MQVATSGKIYTYQDYLQLTDDNQYELIGGELVLVPSPRTVHQRIAGELHYILLDHVKKTGMGVVFFAPIDVLLSDTEKPQPDILFISSKRLNIIKEKYIEGAPDLVIEILSPSTASRDRVEKSEMYYQHGVREYWLVDPDTGVVEVLTRGKKGWNIAGAYNKTNILKSPLLKLQINLPDIFHN